MAAITLNLPDETISRLRQEAQAQGFATAEEYLQSLVAEDLRRRDHECLEAVLLQRLADGRSVEMDDADFRCIAEQAAVRIAAARQGQLPDRSGLPDV
jgi:hypothetical protein